jgi:riboflavin transporter FmnP
MAGAAVFGALAAVMTVSIQIPYPVPGLEFLRFDAAEIIDSLALLAFGPTVGFLTAIVHWIVLNFLPTAVPIYGPLLKLFAVMSMLLGMLAGSLTYSRMVGGWGRRVGFGLITGSGLVSRVLIMTVVNYLFFIFVFSPNSSPSFGFWTVYLGGLGAFNAIHAVISIALPMVVMGTLTRVAPNFAQRMWLTGMKLSRTKGQGPRSPQSLPSSKSE